MQASLESVDIGGVHGPAEQRPAWLSPLCRDRSFFADSIFRWVGIGWERHLKFVYGAQSPLHACFCDVAAAPTTFDDAALSARAWEALSSEWWRHTFDVQCMSYVFSAGLAFPPEAKLDVLFEVTFVGGSRLASDADWVTWESALALLPQAETGTDSGAAVASSGAATTSALAGGALLAKFPWLADFGKDKEADRARASKDEASTAKDVVEDPMADDDMQADAVLATLEALYAKRYEWGIDDCSKAREDVFTVKLLGGAWAKLHRGKDFDAFKGEARASASAWCRAHRLPLSARFEISLYGESDALTMSVAWCHKMQHLYTRSTESADDKAALSADDVLSYMEEPKFTELRTRAMGKTLLRCNQIRALGLALGSAS